MRSIQPLPPRTSPGAAANDRQWISWDENYDNYTPRSEEEFEDFAPSSCAPELTTPSKTSSPSSHPRVSKLNFSSLLGRGQDELVALNVGGQVFHSTASTIRRAPFFDSLMRQAQEGTMGMTLDPDGRFFIDRSGDLFGYVLSYLRTGQWPADKNMQDQSFIDVLAAEATFYGLDTEEDAPRLRIPEYVTIWQFREDTALYVDCLEQTLRDDPDHQGSFRLCKYFGSLPLDAKTNTKRFKASTHGVQSALAYFAARGWALKHVVEGSMITHTTSAEGHHRTGHGVQYILVKYGFLHGPSTSMEPLDIPYAPETQRTWEEVPTSSEGGVGLGDFGTTHVWESQTARTAR